MFWAKVFFLYCVMVFAYALTATIYFLSKWALESFQGWDRAVVMFLVATAVGFLFISMLYFFKEA